MAGFERAEEAFSKISRGTQEAAAVFATGPLDVLKKEYHHGSEFLGYETTEAEGEVHRDRRRRACSPRAPRRPVRR